MKIDKKDVARIAGLAMLKLSEAEAEQYAEELSVVLSYIKKLDHIDTKDILPTAHILSQQNVFREDETHQCLPREEALANAPETEDGMFRVPRVIE
ncbi:MAG: Asp-tRNA(Asn)/Glu-tRNA(Gln) amidotransferase subunit GatC [Firmicutes bacterium]|nr:Asp-tRNA(Asn)/Glu-tRNA(Gln) amidotransferase subunit GatC [Bacillota bacterium]